MSAVSQTGNVRESITRGSVVNNGTLGMMIFIAAELMFFGGLISAFIVNRADNLKDWPPAWQPRLPVEQTAVNTLILLISGVFMFYATRLLKGITKENETESRKKLNMAIMASFALGFFFVGSQGQEWIALVSEGLTTRSSLFGAFFYVIVGAHGIHAAAGLIYLLYVSARVLRSENIVIVQRYIKAGSVYWYFVVLLWPILYVLVYLI